MERFSSSTDHCHQSRRPSSLTAGEIPLQHKQRKARGNRRLSTSREYPRVLFARRYRSFSKKWLQHVEVCPDAFKSGVQFSKCAIVGGSQRINGSKLGSEIDSHDLVIRVNYHPWDPVDGGTKTDVQFVADGIPSQTFCSASGCIPMMVGGNPSPQCLFPVPWYLNNDKIQSATFRLVKARSDPPAIPHSGMQVVFVASKACRKITLYGLATSDDAMAAFWNLDHAYFHPGHEDLLVNEFLVLSQMRRCGWDITWSDKNSLNCEK